ncbi:TonB-dependent receptor domain-containing protein [Pseudoalteromonas fenneropenaei]|uniref:TonB-dependent receptor domain-containing protein n=1 Tax=Pseudoalteromonas fenneropenaei TaxID=1737459 RepID=A0ABV7CM16_9GAMM
MLNKSLLCSAIAAALSFSALADNSSTSLERITVTANKIAQPLNQVLASVTVIERVEIEQSGAADLVTVLQTQAGFQVNANGGLGQNAGVSLRGASTRHTLVLLDGVRVGSATLGYKTLANIPLNSIERIEVVKGSRAAVYGSDALAGVINIITRNAVGGQIDIAIGSDSYRSADLATGTQIGGLALAFNAGYQKTDGFDVLQTKQPDEDGYENVNVGFNAAYQDEQLGDFKAMLQRSQGEAYYDSGFGSADTEIYKGEFTNQVWALGWQKALLENLTVSATLSRATDESDDVGEGYTSEFYTERKSQDLLVQYSPLTALNTLLGYSKVTEDVGGSSTAYDVTERDLEAWFAGATYEYQAWLAEAVVREEHNSQYGNEFTYSTALGYRVNELLTVRASQNTGFKAPTFNDLYYPNSGNLALRPESSTNQELGLTLARDDVSLTLAVFRTDYEDKIAWAPSAGNPNKWLPSNVNQARHEGFELTQQHSFYGYKSTWNYTYLDAKDLDNSKALNYVSKHSANWALSKEWQDWRVGGEWQLRGKREGKYTQLPSYALFNLVTGYTLSEGFVLTLRVENLFDRDYQGVDAGVKVFGDPSSVFYYNTPGRRAYLSFNAEF